MVGQVPCRQAESAVTAADDQQVGSQIQGGGEACLQLAGPVDRERAEQVEPGGMQLAAGGPVQAQAAAGPGC